MRIIVIIGLLCGLGCNLPDVPDPEPNQAETPAPTPMAAPPSGASPTAMADSTGFTPGGIHCNNPEMATCEEASTLSASSPFFRENCQSVGGTVGNGPCPTENRIGYCTPRFGIGSRLHHYPDDLVLPDDPDAQETAVREACQMLGGTWEKTN